MSAQSVLARLSDFRAFFLSNTPTVGSWEWAVRRCRHPRSRTHTHTDRVPLSKYAPACYAPSFPPSLPLSLSPALSLSLSRSLFTSLHFTSLHFTSLSLSLALLRAAYSQMVFGPAKQVLPSVSQVRGDLGSARCGSAGGTLAQIWHHRFAWALRWQTGEPRRKRQHILYQAPEPRSSLRLCAGHDAESQTYGGVRWGESSNACFPRSARGRWLPGFAEPGRSQSPPEKSGRLTLRRAENTGFKGRRLWQSRALRLKSRHPCQSCCLWDPPNKLE